MASDSATANCAVAKCLALTFSGGPGQATAAIVEALANRGARATFFVTGVNAKANPAAVQAIANGGNEVANGTWDQTDLTTLTADAVRTQLADTNTAIADATGTQPTLFRPMGGHTSADIASVGTELGLRQVLWSLDAKDYSATADTTTNVLISQSQRGDVVMLHDTFAATGTAIEAALQKLQEAGYVLVTVSQLHNTAG